MCIPLYNNPASRSQTEDDEKHTNTSKMSCFSGKCLFFFLMSLALFITVTLFAIFRLLANEDKCFDGKGFDEQEYRLYATKTAYQNAIDHLDNPHNRPSIYSKNLDLKTLDEQLRSHNCKIRQLIYLGRHAARYPSDSSIERINDAMISVQKRIDLSKFSPHQQAKTSNSSTTATPIAEARTSDGPSPVDDKRNDTICYNPLAPYKQWQSIFKTTDDNRVTELGYNQTKTIAERFKSIYPGMFDTKTANIDIGTTSKARTAQTALAFIDNIANFEKRPNSCKVSAEPKIYDNEDCVESVLAGSKVGSLEFHKECEKAVEKRRRPTVFIHADLYYRSGNRLQFIAESVSMHLKLAKDNYLSEDELRAIYQVCNYETAISGSSIWCKLFSQKDLKFIEFYEDIEDYYNNAYGHPNQRQSACELTQHLKSELDSGTETSKSQALFYFTHSEVIQRVLARGTRLEEGLDPSSLVVHLNKGTVPEGRDWRTSLLTPFSANLAFSLYHCEDVNTDQYFGGDSNPKKSQFKLVASLNERPIKLHGCSGPVCDFKQLSNHADMFASGTCNLEDICTVKYMLAGTQ